MIIVIKHIGKTLCDHFEPSYGDVDIEHDHELGFMSKYG